MRSSLVLAVALLASARAAPAQTWQEQGDAPDQLPGQATPCIGPLLTIQGVINSSTDVDLYCLQINDPLSFSATVGAGFNPQLWLFQLDGRGVTHVPGPGPVSQLTGTFLPGPGVYVIGVSAYNRAAADILNRRIWLEGPTGEERPPDGPGAGSPLARWVGTGFLAGSYSVHLQGASCCCAAPQLVQCPEWQAVQIGGTATFSVTATGAPPLQYRWFNAAGEIPWATGPELVLTDVTVADHGPYWVRVSNACGSIECPSKNLEVYEGCIPPIRRLAACNKVPKWAQRPVPWNRDADGNGLDDLIDADAGSRHDVLVNFSECPTEAHLEFLEDSIAPPASLGRVFRFIPTVELRNVSVAEMNTVLSHADVAFIEKQVMYEPILSVSVPTMRVSGPAPSVAASYPTLTGAGINIAILDTGVDDPGGPGVTHSSLPAAPYGYNALTDTEWDAIAGLGVNPDDDRTTFGHGTHVASIALGRPIPGLTRGVAPGAGLIDVKVFGPTGGSPSAVIMAGVEKVIEKKADWNIHVINMSLGSSFPSDGTDAYSMLCNLAVESGMILIAAAGNDYPLTIGSAPAAADRAIAVAAANDLNTTARGDDVIAPFSQAGPRLDDSDADPLDELKPEVTAPGVSIVAAAWNSAAGTISASGTSMAAPHVAGLAALALQSRPYLSPSDFRQALITSAEPRGAPTFPALHPAWNVRWGFGYVNGFELVEAVQPCTADMTFRRDPSDWRRAGKRNIVLSGPARFGVPVEICASLRNLGPSVARRVRVEFTSDYVAGRRIMSNYIGAWEGDVPVGALTAAHNACVMWTPLPLGDHPYHQCLRARIVYPCDTNGMNNETFRNVTISRSPVFFDSSNFLTPAPVPISFIPTFEDDAAGWTVEVTPNPIIQGPDDRPRTIRALPIAPPATADGARKTIHIAAEAEGHCLGGVTILAIHRDCNGNGRDDWFDIQDGTSRDDNRDGIPDECGCAPAWTALNPQPLGFAETRCRSNGKLVVRHLGLGVSPDDGARLSPGLVEALRLSWEPLAPGEPSGPDPEAAHLELRARGTRGGQRDLPMGAVRVMDVGGGQVEVTVDFAPAGASTHRIRVYHAGAVVPEAETFGHVGPVARMAAWPDAGQFGHWDTEVDATLYWHTPVLITVVGGETVLGDELRIVAEGTAPPFEAHEQLELGLRDIGQVVLSAAQRTPLRRTGDLNCDGRVDFDDIGGFVLALVGREAYYAQHPNCNYDNADTNRDGSVDFDDIEGFVGCLVSAGGC